MRPNNSKYAQDVFVLELKGIKIIKQQGKTGTFENFECGLWRTKLHSLLESLLFNCDCKLESCKTEIAVDAVKNPA